MYFRRKAPHKKANSSLENFAATEGKIFHFIWQPQVTAIQLPDPRAHQVLMLAPNLDVANDTARGSRFLKSTLIYKLNINKVFN